METFLSIFPIRVNSILPFSSDWSTALGKTWITEQFVLSTAMKASDVGIWGITKKVVHQQVSGGRRRRQGQRHGSVRHCYFQRSSDTQVARHRATGDVSPVSLHYLHSILKKSVLRKAVYIHSLSCFFLIGVEGILRAASDLFTTKTRGLRNQALPNLYRNSQLLQNIGIYCNIYIIS